MCKEICELCHNRKATIKTVDDNKSYCSYCASFKTYQCAKCNNFFSRNHINYFEIDGECYCKNCKNTLELSRCSICNRPIIEDNDVKVCVNCSKEHYINRYTYKPNPIFYLNENKTIRSSDSKNHLFVGVELEINFEKPKEFKTFLTKFSRDKFVYLKKDGSLGKYGVEIVSHPAIFPYHIKTNEWKDIFNKFNKTNTLNCGLHFHLNKNFFSRKEVKFLDYFVNNVKDEICKIGSRSLTNYCQVRKSNRWGYERTSCHTDACNLSNQNTIELRFCKGTNNYKTFIKKIKNIYTLIGFVKAIIKNNFDTELYKHPEKLEYCFEKFKEEFLSRI